MYCNAHLFLPWAILLYYWLFYDRLFLPIILLAIIGYFGLFYYKLLWGILS